MFDMSWGEMLIIGAVALIVIGPKDLPKTLRTVGNIVGKVRRMAGEFQGQFREAIREADLDAVRKDFDGLNNSVSGFDPVSTIRDEIKTAVDKPPESGASPAAIAAATDNAAFTGTAMTPPAAANSAAMPPSVDVPLPAAPPLDLTRDFAPAPAVGAGPLADPAPAPLPDAEPRRAKA
jgi:sec-independent protein translocase protein TatB